MNRIVLIGNGFDLAHGLKTSYKDFIDNFWTEKAIQFGKNGFFQDKEGDIDFSPMGQRINFYHGAELAKCNNYNSLCEFIKAYDQSFKLTNRFLEIITTKCGLQNWVDIEKEFYGALKECFSDGGKVKGQITRSDESDIIENLNRDFERIKLLLGNYLSTIQISSHLFKPDIFNKIVSEFRYREFTQSYKKQYVKEKFSYVESVLAMDHDLEKNEEALKSKFSTGIYRTITLKAIENLVSKDQSSYYFPDLFPNNFLLLNFNYTNTLSLYNDELSGYKRNYDDKTFKEVKVINIHGELKNTANPIIFGFGDEIDEDYSKIENLDDNRFLENIKSTRYHETDNYKKLLEYIDSDYFQIFIFGHSCGLSDRTLLSTLFNHQNCVSIKPFYYIKKDGTDNYSDLVRNISRHFKNKASLRDKVVNKTYCEPLTGLK